MELSRVCKRPDKQMPQWLKLRMICVDEGFVIVGI